MKPSSTREPSPAKTAAQPGRPTSTPCSSNEPRWTRTEAGDHGSSSESLRQPRLHRDHHDQHLRAAHPARLVHRQRRTGPRRPTMATPTLGHLSTRRLHLPALPPPRRHRQDPRVRPRRRRHAPHPVRGLPQAPHPAAVSRCQVGENPPTPIRGGLRGGRHLGSATGSELSSLESLLGGMRMPKGGPRTRSGPSQDPNALRRRASSGGDDWLSLPRAGRPGRAPAWPLSKASARERAIWVRLWKMPQAVAWEQQLLHDQVALYCRRLAVAERPLATSAEATLARQLQDALGLSAPGLRAMRWRIVDPVAEARPAPMTVSARDRLTVVSNDRAS